MHDRMTLDEFSRMIGIDPTKDKPRKREPTVYICGPFRSPTKAGVRRNIARANAYAKWAHGLGCRVLCVHTMYGDWHGSVNEEEMVEVTKAWLPGRDAMLVDVPAEVAAKSAGSTGEIVECGALGIPVFYADRETGKPASWDFEAWLADWTANGQQPAAQLATDDPVKHPNHYTWIPGHECRDITRHLSFNAGSAVKYVYRHRHKGKPVQDLRKAIECLEDEIARIEREP